MWMTGSAHFGSGDRQVTVESALAHYYPAQWTSRFSGGKALCGAEPRGPLREENTFAPGARRCQRCQDRMRGGRTP